MATAAGDAARPRAGPTASLPAGARAWAVFQGARDPSGLLLNIYIFMPYFAATVVGDAVRGQALVAEIATVGGVVVALTAPLLGAALDGLGARKPWIALVTLLHAVALASLWWVEPRGAGLSIAASAAVLVAVGVLFQWGDVLFGALLPQAAPPALTGRASGLAMALGNLGSVLALVFTLWAFVLPGKVALPFVPTAPLLGLDSARFEPERFTGPLCGLVLMAGVVPLLLLTPDARRSTIGAIAAMRRAPGELLRSFGVIARDRDGLAFLLARMIYTDGLATLMIFTGVYTAGVLGWGALDLLVFGILISAGAATGGVLCGWLDGRIGPRRAVIVELCLVMAGAAAQLSLGRDQLFFLPYDAHPIWNGPVFRTLPDLLYLLFGLITGMGICATFGSSRTLLVRIAPPERLGAYFGLFALSGQATAWLGPLLVGVVTAASGSQRAGFAVVLALTGLGLAGLRFVRGGDVSR